MKTVTIRKPIVLLSAAIAFIFISSTSFAEDSQVIKIIDVKGSTTISAKESNDGVACSNNNECKSGVCEGGSCCTDHGVSCSSTSHCCGHPSQGCTNNICPE